MDEAELFFYKHVVCNPYIQDDHKGLFISYFKTNIDREVVARTEGLSIGALLKIFNHTAVIQSPNSAAFEGRCYDFTVMDGVCDDYCGNRYGKFGKPVTIRIYLAGSHGLPLELFEHADWNFMGADRPFFSGYIYGNIYQGRFFVSGIQSDLSLRYSYLYQKPGCVDYRLGDDIISSDNDYLIRAYSCYIADMRRRFQRHWLSDFISIIQFYCRLNGFAQFLIMRYDLEDHEKSPGHIINRIYHTWPQRLGGRLELLHFDNQKYSYWALPVTL